MKWIISIVCATTIFAASCSKSSDSPAPENSTSKSVKTEATPQSTCDSVVKIKKPTHDPVSNPFQ